MNMVHNGAYKAVSWLGDGKAAPTNPQLHHANNARSSRPCLFFKRGQIQECANLSHIGFSQLANSLSNVILLNQLLKPRCYPAYECKLRPVLSRTIVIKEGVAHCTTTCTWFADFNLYIFFLLAGNRSLIFFHFDCQGRVQRALRWKCSWGDVDLNHVGGKKLWEVNHFYGRPGLAVAPKT